MTINYLIKHCIYVLYFRKYQQIIQESNQYIQHLKSELLNIDYFEWTSKKFNV